MNENQTTTAHSPLNEPGLLDRLAYELEEAKRQEAEARNARVAIEEQILTHVGVKEEGSATVKSDYYKVTTTGGMTRTLNGKKWAEINGQLPNEVVQNVVRLKPELDTRQFKALKDLNPQQYAIVAQAVTSKPRKASVKIERLEAGN
ncbi:DUF7173 family protein [Endozoicomonas sp. ALB115]|uniref:DUF7173 family protein n=1 Tax=Endozoicomonas sp. ALB115 TaxID=3403074 RepID=UPI003BB5A4FB